MMKKWISLLVLSLLILPFGSQAGLDEESLFDLTIEELMEVRITIATGIDQPLVKAPATVSVITAKQIKDMGATSLDEVLETVPNIHVTRSSVALDSIYSIRGIQNDQSSHVQLLLNGASITTPYLGGREYGFRLPLTAIKQIEVIRGPGSAVYGADAFAGTINIIAKDGADIDGTEIGVRGGSFDSQDVWLQHGGAYFDWDVAFSFEYQHSDGDLGRKVTRDQQTVFDTIFGTQASLAPGSLNTRFELFDIHLGLQRKQWDINLWASIKQDSGTGQGVGLALDPEGFIDTEHYLLDISYQNADLIDDWLFKTQISYLYTKTHFPLVLFPPGASLPIGSDGNIDFAASTVTFSDGFIGVPGKEQQIPMLSLNGIYSGWASHRIRIATEFQYEDLASEEHKNFGPSVIDGMIPVVDGRLTDVTDSPFVYIADTHRTIWAVSIQDEWKFVDGWHLTAGVRYDYYSDFGDTVNPRIALVWEPFDTLTTKLLYGSAFRAPSFQELRNINNPVILGNPNLKPETIDTFEWSLDYHPTVDLRTALNLFYHEIDDLIEAIADPGAPTRTFQNARNQLGYGFEWEFTWQATEYLEFKGNYAWQHSEDKSTNQVIANTPRQQIYFATNWRFLPNWLLHGQFNWVGKQKRLLGDARSDTEDYLVADVLLNRSKVMEYWDFSVVVKNIFDEKGHEPAPSGFPDDYPIPGRSFFIETRLNF